MTDPLADYIRNFYGYGSPAAKYWFVGMEEGGAAATLGTRVNRWKELGAMPLVDLYEMHRVLRDGLRWFSEGSPIQSTWGKLIRIVLAVESRPISNDAIRTYQRERLGRLEGETALLELMPLPSPDSSTWDHAAHLPALTSREEYETIFRKNRVVGILSLIEKHRPPNVIFYGRRRGWPHLLDTAVTEQQGFSVASRGSTRLIFIRHPTAFGISNSYFEGVGRFLCSSAAGV